MRKKLCVAMVISMVFSMAACSSPESKKQRVVQKKLRSWNFIRRKGKRLNHGMH